METVEIKKTNRALTIATIILSIAVITLGILYGISISSSIKYQTSLENVYQKNFYELVDEVNNAETKLNKILVSNSNEYRAKLLKEVSKNANEAQTRLNMLPYSINGLSDTITFVNKLSGYTETLAQNLDNGKSLSNDNVATLEEVYNSVVDIKKYLNKIGNNWYN